MAAVRSFLGLTIVAFLFGSAMADNYMVGGADGWSLGTDFQTWASSQSFKIGDTLTFTYGAQHSVVEVLKDDYDACSLNNPIDSAADGNSSVILSSPGKRYFVCGTAGHCAGGMKLEVDTASSDTPSVPSQAPAPEGPTVESPPPPASDSPSAAVDVVPTASPPADSPPPASDSPSAADVIPTASPSADSSPPASNSPPVAADVIPTTSPSVDSPPASNSTPNSAFTKTKPQFSAADRFNRQVKVELLLALGMLMALVL